MRKTSKYPLAFIALVAAVIAMAIASCSAMAAEPTVTENKDGTLTLNREAAAMLAAQMDFLKKGIMDQRQINNQLSDQIYQMRAFLQKHEGVCS